MTFDPSSREAEAQAEMAATRLGRGAVTALLGGALLLLASGPGLELAAAARGRSAVVTPFPAPHAGGPLATMEAWSDELELRLDERSALVRAVRPAVQQLLTRFGGYGNERALVGRDGWLFFRDDVEHLTSRRPAAGFAGDPVAEIVRFRDALAARGVALVVFPAPLKPTVHPDRFAAGAAPPPLRRAGERELFEGLTESGVEVVDLADRFSREAPLAPLYLATDTHWRPETMETAARELAIRLRETIDLLPGDAARRESTSERRTASGDTAAMLDLPSGATLFPVETVSVARSSRTNDGPGSVLLLGDSFAATYGAADLGWGAGAGLADRLAAQLGLPVDRILRNAGGASATRQALADAWRRDPERFSGLRVVVWQFAARELSQGEWLPVNLPPPQ